MRRMSFSSVPRPMMDRCSDLFVAAQQMAFALILTDMETAKAVHEAFPEKSPERLLQWAEGMRKEMDRVEWAKALVAPVAPTQNTHPGFFVGVLTHTRYPGWFTQALFSLLETIGQDFLRNAWNLPGDDLDLKDATHAIAAEMVRRGLPHPVSPDERMPLTLEQVTEFLSLQEVQLYICEMQTLHCLNRSLPKQYGGLYHYIVRDPRTGASALVRGRSEQDAQTAGFEALRVTDLKIVEIDVATWVDLGGE